MGNTTDSPASFWRSSPFNTPGEHHVPHAERLQLWRDQAPPAVDCSSSNAALASWKRFVASFAQWWFFWRSGWYSNAALLYARLSSSTVGSRVRPRQAKAAERLRESPVAADGGVLGILGGGFGGGCAGGGRGGARGGGGLGRDGTRGGEVRSHELPFPKGLVGRVGLALCERIGGGGGGGGGGCGADGDACVVPRSCGPLHGLP
mmetsp:Transcript_14440/g.36465  ORF Transcript_14440/g.36465 Transcript_14440/m.36465 type:complete len:205 (-) Transcript_14440:1139-1753(-)